MKIKAFRPSKIIPKLSKNKDVNLRHVKNYGLTTLVDLSDHFQMTFDLICIKNTVKSTILGLT